MTVSGIALILTSPVAISIAVAVRRQDGGPALYRASRVGRLGRDFTMYKFRTMVPDAETLGGDSTSDGDPRVTPLGTRLRRRKLDELPQLLNVLLGNMSLVGPRPQVRRDVDRYTSEERRLLLVKPGVTDWASLKFRNEGLILAGQPNADEAYDELIRPEKMRLALLYVERAGIITDVWILARTLAALCGRGAAPATSPRRRLPFHRVTEEWSTRADDQQFDSAKIRYSVAALLGEGKVLVEVGCGTGFGLAKIAPFTSMTIGIDVEERNLRMAHEMDDSLVLIRGTAETLPLRDGSVDCLTGLEMLYYVQDQARFMRESHRVISSGGSLLITCPNPSRKAFSPSPLSTFYPSFLELRTIMSSAGFGAIIYGHSRIEQMPWVREKLRSLLVTWGVLPSTMRGRQRVKRLIGCRTRELHMIQLDLDDAVASLSLVTTPEEAEEFTQFICIGVRA